MIEATADIASRRLTSYTTAIDFGALLVHGTFGCLAMSGR